MTDPLKLLPQQTQWLHGLAVRLVTDDATARDLVQDTVLRAIQAPKDRRSADPAWLATILCNLAVDRIRKAKAYSIAELGEVIDRRPNGELGIERHESSQALGAAVSQLPEPYRRLILYKYQGGLTATQIGKLFDRTPRWVRVKLAEARDKLRIILGRQFGEDQWALAIAPLAIMGRKARVALPSLLATSALVASLAGTIGLWLVTGRALPELKTELPVALAASDATRQSAGLESLAGYDPSPRSEVQSVSSAVPTVEPLAAASPDPAATEPQTFTIDGEPAWGYRATAIEADFSEIYSAIDEVGPGDSLSIPEGAVLSIDRIPGWPDVRITMPGWAAMPSLKTGTLALTTQEEIAHAYWTDGCGLEVQVSSYTDEQGRATLRVPTGSVEVKRTESWMGVQPSTWPTQRTVEVLEGITLQLTVR